MADEDVDIRAAGAVAALEGRFGFGAKDPNSKKSANKKISAIREGEVFRLTLMGHTVPEMSDQMGLSEKVVRTLLHSPNVEQMLAAREKALRSAALRRVKLQADELMGVIIDIAKGKKGDEKAADRLRAAQTALDRIGIAAGPNVSVNVQVGPRLTTGELIARAETLKVELLRLEADNGDELVELEAEVIDVTKESSDEAD